MNIEDDGEHQSSYREYCLSLGEDIEEKLPFQKFKNGEGVLVFYVMGHMFSFFDCNDFSVISLKCQPERIEDLKAQYECIGNPYNESPKHWIGINDEGNLTIAIENKQEHKHEDKHHHYLRREFSYSNYEQNYVLPDDVVKDQISAKVEDGILTITMPKTETKEKVTKAIEVS